ncbi:hypothetical protein JCM11641_002793 [Rhodosporidiobolus odoratus]
MPSTPDPTHLTAPSGSPKSHFPFQLSFPVYSIQWLDDTRLILAGGGGASRSGVHNRLSLYRLDVQHRSLTLLCTYPLSADEDAPMTIALTPNPSLSTPTGNGDNEQPVAPSSWTLVAGINSSENELKQGKNDNLRVFEVSRKLDEEEGEGKGWLIEDRGRVGTMRTTDADEYQKVTVFSPSASSSTSSSSPLLAIGSTNSQLSLLSSPSPDLPTSTSPRTASASTSTTPALDVRKIEEVWPPVFYSPTPSTSSTEKEVDKEELLDADFDEEGKMLIGTSPLSLRIYPTSSSSNPYISRAPEPVQVIERPVLKEGVRCGFRGARFGRGETSSKLFTIVNTTPLIPSSLSQKQRRAFEKKTPKKAFLSRWDTREWKLEKTRTVSQKPVTGFVVSRDGRWGGFGEAGLGVGVVDLRGGLRPVLTILQAHQFPVTCLGFNPSGTVLVSGSADNSVRVVLIPASASSSSSSSNYSTSTNFSTLTTYSLLLGFLILLVAVIVQFGWVGDEVREVAARAGVV